MPKFPGGPIHVGPGQTLAFKVRYFLDDWGDMNMTILDPHVIDAEDDDVRRGDADLKIFDDEGDGPDIASGRQAATRYEVYRAIDGERDYQDWLGSDRSDGMPRSVGDYLTLLRAYLAKADAAWTDNPGDRPALHVIRKIAGIAVHCMEDHGAPPREAPPVNPRPWGGRSTLSRGGAA
jgi:hypothetical protein